MPRDEAELLAEASRGNQSAFTALYHMYETDLYRFVSYLTDGPETAEELFQETWVRVVKHLDKKPIVNFKKWMFAIATNLYRDELRKRKVRRLVLGREFVEENYGDRKNIATQVVATNVPAEAGGFAIREALARSMKKLNSRQRTIFVLTHVEGFKINEVAETLGIPEGTVKSTLHRAINTLRKELAEFRR